MQRSEAYSTPRGLISVGLTEFLEFSFNLDNFSKSLRSCIENENFRTLLGR
jgi:hypothetical protein